MKKIAIPIVLFISLIGGFAYADENQSKTTISTENTEITVESTSQSELSKSKSSEQDTVTTTTTTTESTTESTTTSTVETQNARKLVEEKAPIIEKQAHIRNIGWMSITNDDNAYIGTVGRNLPLEAFKLKVQSDYTGDVKYSAHVRNIGWQNEVENNQIAGTVGKALPIEAIRIYLTGELANKFDIYYSVHVQNFGWLGWAKNGEKAGSQGYAFHAEAIKVRLIPKGDPVPVSDIKAFRKNFHIYYQSHVRNIGWMRIQKDGVISGTTGKSLSIEALNIKLSDTEEGSLKYRAHVQNIGWQNWIGNNQIMGTTGNALPIEAIQIELDGNLANKYDIYYRSHISNYGWLHWAKNGEISGSTGLACPVEAVQILLVDKGANAPGYTARHYINRELLKNDYIVDLSSYQDPRQIDYDLLSQNIQAAIIRIHHGHENVDKQFAKHILELKKRNIPVAVYAWALGKNDEEMRVDAEKFYSLAAKYQPTFWWIDVEQETMLDMRHGVEVFRDRLKSLGAKKIGVYIANHKYFAFNIDTSKFDGIWIPRYGNNSGFYDGFDPTATNDYDLHQYTSKGKLPGYDSYIDLTRITRKGFEYFFS